MPSAESRSGQRSTWLVICGGFALIVAAVSAVRLPKAGGYEISVYEVYPWYFWTALVVSILCGLFSIVMDVDLADRSKGNWKYGFGLVLLANAVLLSIPILRGYPTYGRADVLLHIGILRDINSTGTIPQNNFYPALHSIELVVSYATGHSLFGVINLFPPVFSLFGIVSMYLLFTQLFHRKEAILVSMTFSSVLLYHFTHVNVSPFTQSVFLVPFVLYLIVSNRRVSALSTRVALVVSLVGITLYHPLTSIFLIVVFLFSVASEWGSEFNTPKLELSNIAMISLATFVIWYHSFDNIIRRIAETLLSLMDSGQSKFDSYQNVVTETSPALIDLVEYGIFRYGITAILSGFSVLYIGSLLVRYRRDSFEWNSELIAFTGAFVFFLGFSVVAFVTNFGFGFGRPLLFALLFGTILTGALFHTLLSEVETEHLRTGVKTALYGSLVVIVVLSTFSVYFSPLVLRTNHQVTEMELDGTEWMFENKDQNKLIDEFGINQFKTHDALYGRDAPEQGVRRFGTTPPAHFNYLDAPRYGSSYQTDTYLLITRLGRITYPEKFPEYRQYWRYTPEEFDRLERDETVARIYDNGEVNAYFIRGIQ